MKILKRLSALITVLGIVLVIAAPLWAQVQRSRMMSLHKQWEEALANTADTPGESVIEKELAEQMGLQVAKLADSVRNVMHLLYSGVLCALIGLGGVVFCLNHEIETERVPNQTNGR